VPAAAPDLSVLRLSRRPPPPFPLAILSAKWMGWVKFTAEAAACPVDFVAAPLLATASALIGSARWAQAWHGWDEPPHLWVGAVGDSGDGKTPGTSALHRRIVPVLERRMADGYADELAEWEAAIALSEAIRANWKKDQQAALKKGNPPPLPPPGLNPGARPEEPRLLLHDVTIEKVAMVLAGAAPKGILMVRDELAGFLLGMSQYNDAARPFWLESWNGGPYRVDRIKHPEPIRIAVATCIGCRPVTGRGTATGSPAVSAGCCAIRQEARRWSGRRDLDCACGAAATVSLRGGGMSDTPPSPPSARMDSPWNSQTFTVKIAGRLGVPRSPP
jgi:hypothetical protein